MGLLSTAGGLLFGNDGGGNFVAYDAATGKPLWHAGLGTNTTQRAADVPARRPAIRRRGRGRSALRVHAAAVGLRPILWTSPSKNRRRRANQTGRPGVSGWNAEASVVPHRLAHRERGGRGRRPASARARAHGQAPGHRRPCSTTRPGRAPPLPLADWLTYNPLNGDKLPQQTEVRAAYDDRYLYFAFRCLDPEPGKVRSTLSRRDNLWNDDWVGLSLDSVGNGQSVVRPVREPARACRATS